MEGRIVRGIFELWKHAAMGIAIAFLLPLTTTYTVSVFSPREKIPEEKEHKKIREESNRISGEIERLKKEREILVGKQKVELQETSRDAVYVLDAQMMKKDSATLERLAILEKKIEELEQKDLSLRNRAAEIRKIFDEKSKKIDRRYNRNLFFISSGIGIIAIIIGALLMITSLSFGFILGGSSTLITGLFPYWGAISDRVKLALLAVTLLLFILLALITFRRTQQ